MAQRNVTASILDWIKSLNIKRIYQQTREGLRSAKGRNLLTFFIFLCISAAFWLLLALNDDVQRDYAVPLQIQGLPPKATLLSNPDLVLSVTVKDKGSSLLRFGWGHDPSLKINFDEFVSEHDSVLTMRQSQLSTAVRSVFGTSSNIVAVRPDSLRLTYTLNPGIKVAVRVDADIHTLPQYAYSGHPELLTDSVMLYSNSHKRNRIHWLQTKPIVLSDLSDSTRVMAQIDVPPGMRAIPDEVEVCIPVEPLVTRKQQIPVEVLNVPRGTKLVTFPAMVDVTYLIPRSLYNTTPATIKATVDFKDTRSKPKNLYVTISRLPNYYQSPAITPETVEYVIERTD